MLVRVLGLGVEIRAQRLRFFLQTRVAISGAVTHMRRACSRTHTSSPLSAWDGMRDEIIFKKPRLTRKVISKLWGDEIVMTYRALGA